MLKVPENKARASAASAGVACRFCGHPGNWPVVCLNTRDMTQRAIGGNDRCYDALREAGGGECGMNYVDANRRAMKRA